jgi:hypothetical protein
VSPRFQIVISRRPPEEAPIEVRRLSLWGRIKFWLAGVVLAAAAVGVLVFVFVVGSVIGIILCAAFVVVIAGLLVKAAFRRVRSGA